MGESPFFNWAAAGLSPSLTEIAIEQLPVARSLVRTGLGKEGYELCPPKGKPETTIFALYALPQALSPKRGFDPISLHRKALGLTGEVGLLATSYGG